MSILGFVTKTCARRFAAPIAAALLATTCAASAATFTYADGTITGLQLTFDTPITGTGYAGQIHLSNVDGSGQTVDVWCVDLPTDFLTGGGTYGVHPSSYLLTRPNGIPALSLSQIGELGALAVHGDLLVASPGSYTSDEVAAAIQLAMWDIEYGVRVHIRRSRFACRHGAARHKRPGRGIPGQCRLRQSLGSRL